MFNGGEFGRVLTRVFLFRVFPVSFDTKEKKRRDEIQ